MIKNTLFSILSILLITSCTNPFNFSSDDPLALGKQHLEEIAQYATFQSDDASFEFISAEGVNIYLTPKDLAFQGNPVSGDIQMKFIEIFDKGTMLVTGMHTTGMTNEGTLEILKSAGTFFIEFSQGDNILELIDYGKVEFSFPSKFPNNEIPNMDLFKSAEIDNNSFWLLTAFVDQGVYENQETKFYEFITNFTNWINCDHFLDDPRPKTPINISLPNRYLDNSRIYLSFDGLDTGLANNFGIFPIGQEVHIIAVSENNNDFSYAIQSATIEDNMEVSFKANEFEKISLENLITEINDLP